MNDNLHSLFPYHQLDIMQMTKFLLCIFQQTNGWEIYVNKAIVFSNLLFHPPKNLSFKEERKEGDAESFLRVHIW